MAQLLLTPFFIKEPVVADGLFLAVIEAISPTVMEETFPAELPVGSTAAQSLSLVEYT